MDDALPLRDNAWLEERLQMIWGRYFSDVERKNDVVISFGRRAAARLGSILREPRGARRSLITITGYFKSREVPDFIVDTVIAHELTHYAHGFSSPHRQLYRHPHEGGVVSKELRIRGMGDALGIQKKWLKKNWREHIHQERRQRV